MTIDITPIITELFHLLELLIGLDFVWSGYWYTKTHQTKRIPKLLGYLGIKLFETGNRKNKSKNQFANSMFSMEACGRYLLFGGIYLVARGMIPLLAWLIK